MNLFDIAAVLICLAALFGYLNHRVLRLESSVGLPLISLVISLVISLALRRQLRVRRGAVPRGWSARRPGCS